MPLFYLHNAYNHAIDIVNDTMVSGWCYSKLLKSKPTTLQVRIDGKVIAETTADILRQDLADRGYHPNGRCGFQIKLPEGLSTIEYSTLTLTTKFPRITLRRYDKSEITSVISDSLPKMIFIHIPKTAGSSFNTYARTLFPQNKVNIHFQTGSLSEDKNVFEQFSFISGHFNFGDIKPLLRHDSPELLSIIREPYGQLHSHINWLRSIGHNQKSNFSQKHHNDFRNIAALIYATNFNSHEAIQSFLENLDGLAFHLFDNCQTRYFLNHRPDRVRQEDSQQALDNMQHFTQIGITENYSDFLEEFCHRHSFQMVRQKDKLNVSRQPKLFDVNDLEIREILLPLVQWDLILYDRFKSKSVRSN